MTPDEAIKFGQAPATDEQVTVLRKAADEYNAAPGKTRLDSLVWGISALIARIAADAETLRKQEGEMREKIADLRGDLDEARDFSRMQTKALENRNDEIRRLEAAADIAEAIRVLDECEQAEKLRAKDEEIERLKKERDEARATKDMHKERQEEAWSELATLRDQARVLRGTLERIIGMDRHSINKIHDVAIAALSSTEPKR